MISAKDIADNAIYRMMNLQEFTVFRDIDIGLLFHGVVPFDIAHVSGGPVEFTVPAITQTEAELKVNAWLDTLESPEC
jgi:hypothetical protein